MQDPEHKLHGTGFYECNVIVQGRQASRSINQDLTIKKCKSSNFLQDFTRPPERKKKKTQKYGNKTKPHLYCFSNACTWHLLPSY